MREAKHIPRGGAYANSDDFRRIFDEDMNSLYLLAFLLTADRAKAERCFVSGLEDAVEGNPVFKEWARSWARRAIIQNAVRVVNPRPIEGINRLSPALVDTDDETLPAERQAQIAAVLGLYPFERLVYVMTVLEHYSDHECSLLLGCARRHVLAARTRAFQELERLMEIYYQQLRNASAQDPGLHERRSSALELMVAAPLAHSA